MEQENLEDIVIDIFSNLMASGYNSLEIAEKFQNIAEIVDKYGDLETTEFA